MLPTPSTAHVDFNRIYEPAEDSYLLLDTLSSTAETQFLTQRFGQTEGQNAPSPTPTILEVGTGSGVVLAFAAANARTIFGRYDVLALGTDMNRFACQATKQTALDACHGLDEDGAAASKDRGAVILLATLNADLTGPLRSGVVDVLIFNPPYLPSRDVPGFPGGVSEDVKTTIGAFEHDSHLLSLSYEGGVDGMQVTDRLLDQLPFVLHNERGVAYVLFCQQNKPDEVMERIRAWGEEWSVENVRRSGKVAGWEKLCVIKIWKN